MDFEYKSCKTKRAFHNRKVALSAMHSVTRHEPAKYRGIMNAYKCRFCRDWHIGHAPWLKVGGLNVQ